MTDTQKVCVICKQDCSTVPRIKNGEGRYACRSCVETKQKQSSREASAHAAQQQRPRTFLDADDGEGFIDLSGVLEAERAAQPTMQAGSACPGCGMRLQDGQTLCLDCGYDTTRGKPAKQRKIKEAKPERTDDPSHPGIARMGIGAACAAGGAIAGTAIWIPASIASGNALHVLTFVVGGFAGAASLIPVRGYGTKMVGLAAALATAIAVAACIAIAPADKNDGYDFTEGGPRVHGLDESARAFFPAVWLLGASCAAYGLASSNPYDDEEKES